jgi:hypothetical protein
MNCYSSKFILTSSQEKLNMSTADQPFRVIVIGGGVAELTASHCLQKAQAVVLSSSGWFHIVQQRILWLCEGKVR